MVEIQAQNKVTGSWYFIQRFERKYEPHYRKLFGRLYWQYDHCVKTGEDCVIEAVIAAEKIRSEFPGQHLRVGDFTFSVEGDYMYLIVWQDGYWLVEASMVR